MSEPEELVFTREETIEETARLVVVAAVVVERSARKPPVKVELAVEIKPWKKPNVVEVETPQAVVVQAKAEPLWSAAQPKTPPEYVKTLPAVQVERPKPERLVPERLVVEAVVEKKLVVVAAVVVDLLAVKFCKVEEPVRRRLERVARPEELIILANKLVLKKLVEVAAVVVERVAVKAWRVVEPTTRRSPEELMVEVAVPPIERMLPVRVPAKRLVEVAEVVVL